MTKIYSTNEICKLCDISRKRLRYYEERGMLAGVLRNENNNYRFYTIEHIKQIIAAKELKNIRLSLDEIRELFFEHSISGVQLTIEKKIQSAKEDVEQSLLRYEQTMVVYARLMEAVAIFKNHLSNKNHREELSYEVVDFPARDIISLKYYATFEDEERQAIEQAAKIQVAAKDVNVAALGSLIYLTFDHFDSENCVFDNKRHLMKAAMPVVSTDKQCAYYDRIERFKGVSTLHFGDFPVSLKETYIGLLKWAKEKGYKLANNSVEEWLIGSTITNNQNYWLMRVIIPFSEQ